MSRPDLKASSHPWNFQAGLDLLILIMPLRLLDDLLMITGLSAMLHLHDYPPHPYLARCMLPVTGYVAAVREPSFELRAQIQTVRNPDDPALVPRFPGSGG